MTQTIAKGKCAFRCGEPVHEGKRLCAKHLEHQRLKMAEYRQKRKSQGLCSRCDKPARKLKNGQVSTLCNPCREHVRDLERSLRDKQVSLEEAEEEAKLARRIVRMRTSGKTPKEISLKVSLPIEAVRQILKSQSN